MAFTFFFRDQQALDMVVEHVIPALKTRRYIKIWDAGCAMGPEPYTFAILFRENMGHFLYRNVKIHATDIDESDFGTTIQRGVYSETELGRIPRDIFDKYFTPDGAPGYFQISQEIRESVCFERHDLTSLQPVRTDFGLIICKNVLLHFSPEMRVQVIKMFHSALDVGGFFVTEQTQKLPPELDDYFVQVTNKAQLFQKV